VLAITAGVDVQDDRLEITFLGWSREEIFVLGHSVVWGAPSDNTTWTELDDALKTVWKHPNGGVLRLDAAVIDSGDGGVTDLVYSFTRPRLSRRVVSGKGVAGFARPAIQRSSAKGTPLFLIGVDALKSQLLNRLSRGRTIRFSRDLDSRFFEELTSERRVVRYVRGQPTRRFERIPGRRAEALDSTVYAMAARSLVNMDLGRREAELSSVDMPAAPKTVIRSAWLNR
jgi:phage terminase large subunit GpA-like protein